MTWPKSLRRYTLPKRSLRIKIFNVEKFAKLCSCLFFFLMIRPPPISPLFPYTPLFRSPIPASTAQWVLTEILTQGRVRRAWLGVGARDRPLDLRLVRALGLTAARAVEVLSRESEGPAAESDLQPGDLIVAVDDSYVDGVDALHRRLGRVPPGSTLTLRVVRRTQLVNVALTVREPPP